MEKLVHLLVGTTISMSILIIVYLLLTPILAKRYSAKWRYYAWLVVVLGLLVPFRPSFDIALIQFEPSYMISSSNQNSVIQESPSHKMNNIQPNIAANLDLSSKGTTVDWYAMILIIWLVGTVVVSFLYIYSHRKFLGLVKRWSKEINSSKVTYLLDHIQKELNLSHSISLRTCPFITSPMMVGFKRIQILLPHTEFSHQELELIFIHELVHLKRKDLWYKTLAALVTIVYWFNPFVYLMSRTISNECEASCDEEVIRYTNGDSRKLYGETILSFTINKVYKNSLFSTQMFGGGKKAMKTRIAAIMDKRPKKKGYIVLLIAIIAIIMSGVVFAFDKGDLDLQADYVKQLHAKIEEQIKSSTGWQIDNDTMWYAGNPNFLKHTLDKYEKYGIAYDSKAKEWTYKGQSILMFRDADDRYLNFTDNAIQNGVSVKVMRAWNTRIEGLEVMTKEDEATFFDVELISRKDYKRMSQIVEGVNAGKLPESALLEAQPLLKRQPYYYHRVD